MHICGQPGYNHEKQKKQDKNTKQTKEVKILISYSPAFSFQPLPPPSTQVSTIGSEA